MNDQSDHLTRQRVNGIFWRIVLKRLIAGFVVLVLLPKAGPVHAANTWTVTKTDDTNDGVCDADCSIREAIAVAAPGDTVTLPPGTYTLWLNHLFINKDLTINGSGTGGTILAQTNPLFRVIDIGNPGGTAPVVSISRLTIKGGHAIAPSNSEALPGHEHGGGLHNHGTVTLTNVTFTANAASDIDPLNGTSGKGGGIWNAGNMTLINVTIADNSAAVSGAGIGGIAPTIINTIVAFNNPDNCSVAITNSSNNLDSGDTCVFRGTGDLINTNPLLGTLTDGVYPLLAGSPAINTGTNTLCPPTDQLGATRPQGPFCDIGAFEWADLTPPVIVPSVSPAPNANGWNNTDVTVTWNVSDPESVIDTSSGCGNTTLTSETGGTTLTCTATNAANLSSSESVTVKIDKTAPTVTYTGNAGTYTLDQTVNITCSPTDNRSGVATTTCMDINAPASSFGLGSHTLSATATDNAGNVGNGSTTFTVVDLTPPVISANVTPPPNAHGWNNTDVTVTWNVSDPESGIASSSGCDSAVLLAETGGTLLTCSATNNANLSSSESVTLKIDKTPPTVTYTGNAGTYTPDQTVNIHCSADDTLSAVDTDTCANISGPASSFGLGAHTFSAMATDKAGNTGNGSTTFTVAETPSSGADTTGVFRPGNGLIFLKNSNSTGIADISLNYGIPGDYPVVGDWDGNGTATIGVYRNGQFLLRNSNTVGFADLVFAFGQPGDQPIAGDWNGDGVDTVGIYRPSTGQFFLRNSNSAGVPDMSFFLGNAGDVGIAGDWDGDGMDTTGVFRPSNGMIFLKNSNSTGIADIALNYGIPGDQPVTGDWDNNGTDTIGVYRNGQFLLRNSNTVGFADIVFGLGNPGDMPIAGNWDGAP